MKLFDVLKNVSFIENHADHDITILGISSDSRKIREGYAFVSIKGLHSDGNDYISAAMKQGAVLVITEKVPTECVPYVLVEDTSSILPTLLSNFYDHPESKFKRIIGITGTNGKTTTSFMLKMIFESAGETTGLIGTMKYLIGNEEYCVDPKAPLLTTPDPELLFELLDAMAKRGVSTVIMEASSHALELKKLNGIRFDFALFTNFTQDHMDFHHSMEEYLQAKKKLFFRANMGIFNADDPSFSALSADVPCQVVTYSVHRESTDYRCEKQLKSDENGVAFSLQTKDGRCFDLEIPIPGDFTVYNVLAAASCALECKVDPETLTSALKTMSGVKGRLEKIPIKRDFSVFIDFAHTPDALENILRTLRAFTKGRLITLFGCGGDRDKTKRPVMGEIASRMSDLVIVTSDNSRSEEKEAIIADIVAGINPKRNHYVSITDRTEAIQYALSIAQKGDVILLAGKGHEEYEIDRNGKRDYSEKNIVLKFIGE